MDLKRIDDESKNGIVETYIYDNGQLESRKNFKNDKLNGLYEAWSKNGQLKSRTNYKNGKLDGLRESWYENGKPRLNATYKNDELDGLRETWYENGQLAARETCKNDKLEGLREVWYKNGKPRLNATYKDGKLDGLHNEWDENGQLKESIMYKDGVAVEQESDRNVSKEEELLRLERENLAMKIMLLRDRQVGREITFKESLKQSISLIEEYEKNSTATSINYTHC